MVKCKTIDVEVPASAEIVLECEILPDGWVGDEGPIWRIPQGGGLDEEQPDCQRKGYHASTKPYLLLFAHAR